MGGQPTGFSQPMVFGASPAVQSWTQPSTFGASNPPPAPAIWGSSTSMAANTWSSTSPLGNPFQSNIFPPAMPTQSSSMLSSLLVTPPQPPPRTGPPKDIPSDAFTALDPLGDKEVKEVKEMFKDFQLRQPPAVPARKGEQPSSGTSSAFSSYFNNKVGIPQENADHDDFDANQLLNKINGKLLTSLLTVPTGVPQVTQKSPLPPTSSLALASFDIQWLWRHLFFFFEPIIYLGRF